MSEDVVKYWRGRPIADLSHEELLDAFQTVCRMYHGACKDHDHAWGVMSALRRRPIHLMESK